MIRTNLRSVAEIEAKKQQWLIPNWLPRGAITIVDGDPGQGKSLLTLTIAAAISKGGALPMDEPGSPPRQVENVLLISCEDDASTQTKPRLCEAGADVRRVYWVDGFHDDNKYRLLKFPGCVDLLTDMVATVKPALIVLDPVMSFLSADVRTYSDQAVRDALRPLVQLAEDSNVAIVLVRHLNKGIQAKAIYRGGGSIGFVGLARAAFMVAPNPETKGEFCLCQIKNNFGKLVKPFGYRIENGSDAPRIHWTSFYDFAPDQVLRTRQEDLPIDRAKELLNELLKDGHLAHLPTILAEADKRGITKRTLIRAKSQLGVKSQKLGIDWYWSFALGQVCADDLDAEER